MLSLALGALLIPAGQAPCPPEAAALVEDASARAAEFDLPGTAERLAAARRECAGADAAAVYVRGLIDAREAFRQGGAAESLAPVREAIATLERTARGRPGPPEIARLMLHAAAAAAQGERDEMQLYLEAAVRMESLQRAAGQPGAPVVTAAEIAGDLWLQIHRYEDARRAYRNAFEQVGMTPRVVAGLARAAARLDDHASACAGFQQLLEVWGTRQNRPAEIVEARTYVDGASCRRALPP